MSPASAIVTDPGGSGGGSGLAVGSSGGDGEAIADGDRPSYDGWADGSSDVHAVPASRMIAIAARWLRRCAIARP
ncbi:hypothetical protein NPS01_16490 [Nocardioides psychrotolerans]|nr:hypothetical protein NPS01_16490 [Nocardioides psychrotolerans]